MKPEVIVRTYIREIRPHAQGEIDWFVQQPSLSAAIEKAALATNSHGKRYSHQCRVKKIALKRALNILLDNERAIKKVKNFDDLFKVISGAVSSIPGIGELYIYDTALRIGAKLNLFPTAIYLHAGTRAGARALGLNDRATTLPVSVLPRQFRALAPHELEDVLCIFKRHLSALTPVSARDIAKRSWCS
jgi:hypothetical protein